MPTEPTEEDKRAPMAPAPMKYLDDGLVDWGNMWDTFCVLAQDGGPPHRPTMLLAPEESDVESAGYKAALDEIIRGVRDVSGLTAEPGKPGWIAVRCKSAGMAHWLSEAIAQENVQARSEGASLFVPVGEHFTLKGEIKNVITAVAKTTHYWKEHIPMDIKMVVGFESRFNGIRDRVRGMLGVKRDA